MTSRAGSAGQFLRDVHGRVTDAVTRFTDPREKQIRRTRKARRRSVRLGTASGITGTGTVGLAIASSAPDWTIVAGGGATALFAVPAVMAWQRFRTYRTQPLPPVRPARRFNPAYSSAVYHAMLRLGDAEQSLYRMLTVLSRAEVVPHSDLEEISVTSAAAGDALEATGRDVVEMEHAQKALRGRGQRRGAPGAQHDLRLPISALADQVTEGVEEIEALARAASQMTEAVFDRSRSSQPGGRVVEAMDKRRAELLDAADRLEGLAHGLRELNTLRGQPGAGPAGEGPLAMHGARYDRIDPLAAPDPSIAPSTRRDPGRARPRSRDERPWHTA